MEGDGGSPLGPPGGGAGGRPRFPELPILKPGELPPAAPPRGQREKYGALFYLGISGLVVLVALIGWFGHGLWSNRDIWADVYALNDTSRPESDRLDAALRLARNPRLDDGARMETARAQGPAPTGAVPAGGVGVDRDGGARPAVVRHDGGAKRGLARLAPAPPVAPAGLRRRPGL